MRHLLLIAALASPLVSAAERTYIHEFYDARKLEQSDPDAAVRGMTTCLRLAVEAGNADYATAAGLSACHLLYRQGKILETGTMAREVIDALDPLPAEGFHGDAVRRCQLFGFVERGLLMEGKVGAAWQANRAGAETLRGKKVRGDGDGASITVAEVIALPSSLRPAGWRLIEREAELLDVAGRTVEARRLLDEAAEYLGRKDLRLAPVEDFYAAKLLASRAMLLDFLGYEAEAIALQQDLLARGARDADTRRSLVNVELNLMRNLSQWEGPTEALFQRARDLAKTLKSTGPDRGVDRLLAKMELDLKRSEEALAVLRAEARDDARLGYLFDAIYSGRDSLVERAATGEDGLDGEFAALLARMRAQGNKRGEPNLYREYGDYLLDRDRPVEAIGMFREALRLTRTFGLVLHEPAVLSKLFNAHFEAGDTAGARAVLAELEAFLAAHPDLPAARRVAAETGRALALARLGKTDAAKAALALARTFAGGLPAHRTTWLTAEMEARILREAAPVPAPATAALMPLRVQPLEISSIAPPGGSARTRFTVFNPHAAGVAGHLVIDGPGATAAGESVRFQAGEPTARVRMARTISAGGEAAVSATLAGDGSATAAEVRVAWAHDGQEAGPATRWDVSWDAAAAGSVVLDASSLEADPFRSVVLFHELAVPAGETTVPFRLVSGVPLRFEYYDSRSRQLVAIDADGDGDFTERGDLHVRGPQGVAAAILPVPPGESSLAVEVRIFAADGGPAAREAATRVLAAEVFRDGHWSKEAENTLK